VADNAHDAGVAPPGADRGSARELLKAERAAAAATISALARDFDGIVNAASSVATDDEHDPEGATIAFERAQVAALLERARGRLADVDLALGRIADGSYGRCGCCGGPIAAERLAARPTARTCIRCATAAG
jgi:RNA polymerase-binding transcription factor DksA